MAEENEEDTGEEDVAEGEGKSGPDIKKLALFVGLPAVIVVLALVAGALFLFGGGDSDVADAEGEDAVESAAMAAAAAQAQSYYVYDIEEPLIVNVQAASGATMLLSLRLQLEIADPSVQPVLDARMGRVLDQYAAFLRELSPDDLAGSAGLHRVRLELLRRTNLAIAPARVEGVLITQMLVTQS